jgi:pSer/pThr/pTyr-binding forkhead associated (FHA) protein
MRTVAFLVLDGVDKGRVFRDLAVPVTIGREEGNVLRLNDERISRFHAKVQCEDKDIILTDLDSTNGTRVNGAPIQIRRLRPGDQVSLGRSTLLFGTMEEIEERRRTEAGLAGTHNNAQTVRAEEVASASGRSSASSKRSAPPPAVNAELPEWTACDSGIPPLPAKLTGSQVARLAEIFDHLHRGLSLAVENISANEAGTEVRLAFAEWQTIQAVQHLLARYSRTIAEPNPPQ